MTVNSDAAGAPVQAGRALGPRYKWIALSNTTLGMLMATINQSIVLIALPDIFRGIGLNPLSADNTSYLLWMFMGFLVVSAVLVVSFGRLGDMFGRVRMYTLGFAVFSVASIFLTVTWQHGTAGAMWLIIWRVVQGIGGALLFANAAAIVTDAFPASQRGRALSVNSIAAIAGSFIGLILGGVLAPVNWHLIFLVSAPIGVFGTLWAYFMLHDIGIRKHAQMDWWGNLLFAAGLVSILVGITYGLLPYGGHPMGWTNPWVLTALFGGLALLVSFVYVETRVAEPLFRISLFRIRAFAAGNIASLMLAMGRGRHDRHLPELRVRALDRYFLHPDGGRPVEQAPGGHVQRADRAGRPGRLGHADLAPPSDRRAVRLLPRLQPDTAAAWSAAA